MDYGNITLFETSWEVCNKVGGIYAVVSSKALQAIDNFGENYWLLGPDLGNNADFEESSDPLIDSVHKILHAHNLECRLGHWKIPGNPKAILVSFKNRYDQNQLLFEYWKAFSVDSMSGAWDYVEPVMFATACGEVIATLYQHLLEPMGSPAIAQFHEWMCGAGLLYLKRHCPPVGTVFTTHATMLGRSLAGNGKDLYSMLDDRNFDPRREAASLGITAKFSMESVSAREADCFTTVSDITAEEASIVLGRKPDIVTPNGLDLRVIPDFSTDRERPEAYRAAILQSAGRLLRRNLPEDTRIVLISGRYEFHNKGVDVFLEALAKVKHDLASTSTHVLALCCVMGGYTGVNDDAVSGDPARMPADGGHWLCSHHVHNASGDEILAACRRLGLDNNPASHVSVIFDPALLNGRDGFLNLPYEEVLAASDLGVFPSWYEPWGYTPEESAAYAVPTVTSDLAGFGIWVRSVHMEDSKSTGVSILQRRQKRFEDTVVDLQHAILSVCGLAPSEMAALRKAARHTASLCDWTEFFPFYIKAYNLALSKALEHGAELREAVSDGATHIFMDQSSLTPLLHPFTALTKLPKPVSRLRELGSNLWWCWHPECWSLFMRINPDVWESSNHNPLQCLEEASDQAFSEMVADSAYVSLYEETLANFDDYMKRPLNEKDVVTAKHPIAYFSTEYGLHESLPIYSGGLGVLSGDHLKSASDMNIPLVAIGLFYRYGYFRQQIDKNGRQVAVYPENDITALPMEAVRGEGGEQLEISIQLPERRLFARVWVVKVGTIPLYLLDTNLEKNTPDDRKITDALYVADRDFRVRQEILLGIGGVELLDALGITPSVFHMNEGHSAFLILERIRRFVCNAHLSFKEAGEIVRSSCVFTTHTPVEAGNERFRRELMTKYFAGYANNVGITLNEFLDLGRMEGGSADNFEMTVLALRFSARANGVSRLHGDVSRHMWQKLWQGMPIAEVPIGHVTNGVHMPSYVGTEMAEMLVKNLGKNWMELSAKAPGWYKFASVPDKFLWRIRLFQKTCLLDYVRSKLPEFYSKLGVSREDSKLALSRLSENTLLIGFARRFAPYKRANLLFADLERLDHLLSYSEHPVALLFAGKAHPADGSGMDIMQEIIRHCTEKRFLGRIFFLEDYSLAISRLMVQGCDVWLNTPRRPYEASGTSGQKCSINGVLNLSISDGWWCEGYNGENGWTIGPVVTRVENADTQNDYADAEALYNILEEQVIPLYYYRNQDGVPTRWVQLIKESMRTLIPNYSSHRMVRDYLEMYYEPTAMGFKKMLSGNFKNAKRICSWKEEIQVRFSSLKLGILRVDGMEGDSCDAGQDIHVTLSLDPGAMKREEILVQLVVGPWDGSNFTETPDITPLSYERTTSDQSLVFSCNYQTRHNGSHAYGVRVIPMIPELGSYLDSHLCVWA